MLALTEEPSTVRVVSRADNRDKLEQIDTSITDALHHVSSADRRHEHLSARIVAAAVQMLDIVRSDPDSWEAFKKADPKREFKCKGKGWDGREVASVIWREHKTEKPNRERVSVYGKATLIAHEAYWGSGVVATPDELLDHVTNAGGVKGLIRAAKIAKGKSGPSRITLPIPDSFKLVMLRHDGSYEDIDHELAKPFLIQIGMLQ